VSAPTATIARCSAGHTWRGEDTCHCAGCHQTFADAELFAAHRRPTRTRSLCKRPGELGLACESGVWKLPPMPVHDRRARWAALRAIAEHQARTEL
jgi:hypothetical protein